MECLRSIRLAQVHGTGEGRVQYQYQVCHLTSRVLGSSSRV